MTQQSRKVVSKPGNGWLITRRSQVQILPPLLRKAPETGPSYLSARRDRLPPLLVDTPAREAKNRTFVTSCEGGRRVLEHERDVLRDLLLRAHVPLQLLFRSWGNVRLLPRPTRLRHP